MTLAVPEAIRIEHQELHGRLHALTRLSGHVGATARTVAHLLHAHFQKEEELALPPLALLPVLAEDGAPADADEAFALAARLRGALPAMLEEHRAIGAALEALAAAGESEGNVEAVSFAEALRRHAEAEEQVLYPAAILVGAYLKLWMNRAE
jgi:hypothetical protein